MRVKIIKTADTRFNGNHPNNIFVGYQKEGELVSPVKVGEAVYLSSGFHTSTVTEIVSETEFKTLNSVYKIEYL